MTIPPNVKTYELSSSILWIDEKGIVYSLPKPGAPPEITMEEVKKEMDKFRQIIGNKKVCLIIESNANSKAPKKEQRDAIAAELDSVTKAMAIISTSPLSRMIANLFFGLKPPPYPVKMCSSEEEARSWMQQYCN
jgi:hypothetical protein